jgi:hypothetical protein
MARIYAILNSLLFLKILMIYPLIVNIFLLLSYLFIGDYMINSKYDRINALNYARTWALKRNPKYYNYDNIGGDCTNFVSQCIYEGSKVMNHAETFGWYYYSANKKSPSWTGVEYLFNFLTKNSGIGPYGNVCSKEDIEQGDIIQLSFDGNNFAHSLFVVDKVLSNIWIATHTFDAYYKNLNDYNYQKIRFLHIDGIRKLS